MEKELERDAEEVAKELGFENAMQLNTVCDVIITTAHVIKEEKQNSQKMIKK